MTNHKSKHRREKCLMNYWHLSFVTHNSCKQVVNLVLKDLFVFHTPSNCNMRHIEEWRTSLNIFMSQMKNISCKLPSLHIKINLASMIINHLNMCHYFMTFHHKMPIVLSVSCIRLTTWHIHKTIIVHCHTHN